MVFLAALPLTAAALAHATILFPPVNRGHEVLAFNGTTRSAPLTDPNALKTPDRVFHFFCGPQLGAERRSHFCLDRHGLCGQGDHGSSYLSGLKQYGSDGFASFGGYAIDTSYDPTINPSQNPVYSEANKFLNNPAYSSWRPPAGDARTSPIYAAVRYGFNGTNVGGSYGGSTSFGPNQYTPFPINVIDVYITTADQVDQFIWVFTHELVERMSTGTGGLAEVSPDKGGQIADGEPEGETTMPGGCMGRSAR